MRKRHLAVLSLLLLTAGTRIFSWNYFSRDPAAIPLRGKSASPAGPTSESGDPETQTLADGRQPLPAADEDLRAWGEWRPREALNGSSGTLWDWTNPTRNNSWSVWRGGGNGGMEIAIFEDSAPGEITEQSETRAKPIVAGEYAEPASLHQPPGQAASRGRTFSRHALSAPAAQNPARPAPPDQDDLTRSAAAPEASSSASRGKKSASAGLAARSSGVRKRPPSRRPLLRVPRFRPLLLSRLLGKKSIRPPKGPLKAPGFDLLIGRIPSRTDLNAPVDPRFETPRAIENILPPGLKSFPEPREALKDFHWHGNASERFYHSGSDWGRAGPSGWAWFKRAQGRWWIQASPESVLVRHSSRWWWQANGVWFLLHEGQPWGYRYFPEWQSEGLINPGSGTIMIYSADGARIALVTPGRGAVVFDAYSGLEVSRLSEDQLPRRPQPRAPSHLSLPP